MEILKKYMLLHGKDSVRKIRLLLNSFANIKLTTEELSSFMTAMKDARMDEEEIARKWRDEHRQLVDSWIPKSENK